MTGGKTQGRHRISGPAVELVLLFASLFAAALTRQRFLHSLFLARLKVEGVTFHFLNNVLCLNFALEAAQGILQGFALLNTYFCQPENTPKLVPNGHISYPNVPHESQVKSPTTTPHLSGMQPHEGVHPLAYPAQKLALIENCTWRGVRNWWESGIWNSSRIRPGIASCPPMWSTL